MKIRHQIQQTPAQATWCPGFMHPWKKLSWPLESQILESSFNVKHLFCLKNLWRTPSYLQN